MRRLIHLAWRDVWRHRRRTILTMSAIVFAVMLISVVNSLQTGTYDALERTMIRLSTSEIQVQHQDFHEEPLLEHSLDELDLDIHHLMDQHPWIQAATRRVTGFGLASSDSASAGVMIMGVDPQSEPEVSNMMRVREGDPSLAPGDHRGVLLGVGLARNLQLSPGDSVVMLTQGYQNVMGAEIYSIRGLASSGMADLDRSLMVTTLPAAQELLNMPGRYTSLVVRTDQHSHALEHVQVLQQSLNETPATALPWQTLMSEMVQLRRLDDVSNGIIYAFLILLIGFEIFNTMAMSMMERTREFGVMMAMGLKPSQISGLVVMELAMKVLLGIVVGLVVSSVLVHILGQQPIPLTEAMIETYEELGFGVDGLYFSTKASIYIFPVVGVTVLSLISAVFPVVRMLRFSPVKALRAI